MTAMSVRPAAAPDRAAIARLLARAEEFRADEAACALELFDESFGGDGSDEDYHVLCAEAEEKGIIGFVCWGKIPLTRAACDLYWIVIDPAHRRSGVARRMLRHLEGVLREKAITLLVAETSSLSSYAQARAFYVKEGFTEESRIRDFYAPGDDRVIYCKRL
jgi:ribosomal protein S18 acetylase RimI-like enzyme